MRVRQLLWVPSFLLLSSAAPHVSTLDEECQSKASAEECHGEASHEDSFALLQVHIDQALAGTSTFSKSTDGKLNKPNATKMLVTKPSEHGVWRWSVSHGKEIKQNNEAKARPHIMQMTFIMVPVAFVLLGLVVALVALTRRMEKVDEAKWYYLTHDAAVSLRDKIDVAACFGGIILLFVSYGIAQEYIITETYGGEKFPSVPFLILCNRLVVVLVASTSMVASGEGLNFEVSKWAFIPSATVLISSFCQYQALNFVTFPTQVMFKSGKIVPTMAVNRIFNRVAQPWSDYLLALVITGSVMGFAVLSASEAGTVSPNTRRDTASGIALLCLFLVCDALTSNTEKWMFNKDREYSNTQMMFAMGVVTLAYSVILTAVTNGGFPVMYAFLERHPESYVQVLLLALFSTCGQWVIYYTVRHHGPVLLAVMMTVRQVVSILCSAAFFDHDIPRLAIACCVFTFAACLWKPIHMYLTTSTISRRTGGTPRGSEKRTNYR